MFNRRKNNQRQKKGLQLVYKMSISHLLKNCFKETIRRVAITEIFKVFELSYTMLRAIFQLK